MTTLAKGSTITATVEEALDNCVVVRVIHGSKTFRGVLLDERNSLISRTPKREEVEKTRGTADFSGQERSGVVLLQNSPRRTANSRKSGISQRLILLSQQEEGRSDPTIVNSMPTDDLGGFVSIDRSKLRDAQKRCKPAKGGTRPSKTARGSASKAKTSSGVKRKKNLPKDNVRPFKKSKFYSPSEIEQGIKQGKISNGIVQPCLVKVCPLMTKPGILNQSSTPTEVQTLPAPNSDLNFVSEERIARQFNSGEGQNVQVQAVTKTSEVKRLSVDLEQLPMGSGAANEVLDTVSLSSDEQIVRQFNSEGQTVQIEAVTKTSGIRRLSVDVQRLPTSSGATNEGSDTINLLSEEQIARQCDREGQNVETQAVTKTSGVRRLSLDLKQFPMSSGVVNKRSDTVSLLSDRTGIIDIDRLSERVVISDEETDSATSFMDEHTTSETVEEKTDMTTAITNQDEEFETVDILSEVTTDIATSFLGKDVERTENLFREKAAGNTEASTNYVGENTIAVTTHPQSNKTIICQNTPQSGNKVSPKLYNRIACVRTDPKSPLMQVVPRTPSENDQLSNCSESSTAMLSIVVKLNPLNMETREAIPAPKPIMQSDAGCRSPRLSVEDIVWGKVHNHPWWPGKVFALSGTVDEVGSMSAKDASIAWFGSNTSSVLPVTCLSPFVANFHTRHSPDKEGCYRIAVQEAIQANKKGLKHYQ